MNACTIVARNYLAQARVLADSFLEHHPTGTFIALFLDDLQREVDESGEPFQVVHVDEIGIDRDELHRMAMIYDVLEFATAVKPWFLRILLDRGFDHIAYFDPDIEVFAPLDDIAEHARESSIVLTPHVTAPIPRDGLEPSERTILRAGMHNLGFVAVGSGAREFLEWWSARLARDCLVDPDQGQFVDQRWVDFVPSLFDHHVVRDPGCNVATWNLHGRVLTSEGDRVLVNGEPLRFYHYSGFNPRFPHVLSKFQGDLPRIFLEDRPMLAQLCRDYADALMARGFASWSDKPYTWNHLPDGTRIDRDLRRRYRDALLEAEQSGRPLPPDPFDPGSAAAFQSWRQALRRPGRATLSRYARALYDVDPDAPPARLARVAKDRLRARRAVRRPSLPSARATGIGANVAGYFRAELGIGEAARQIVSAFEHASIPFSTVTYDRTLSRQEHPFSTNGSKALYDTNIVCVNADQTLVFRQDVGREFFDGRYSIGVWFWEVADFPASMHGALDAVDEVWVASDFVRDAVAAHTPKPVLTIPLPVSIPEPAQRNRGDLDLPDDYLFLFSYDFLSVFERKNPLGLLDAFTRAFEPGEGPVLVLKSINGDLKAAELDRLRAAAGERPDVLVRDGYLSADDKLALTATCDCYVSLHRSEGFGLTMAEAMALGKPVIATAYSGNLAFMDEENGYLVSYSLGRVPAGCDPYPVGTEWAEPDLDEAAALMRRVWENRDEAEAKGRAARESIANERSPEPMAAFLSQRLGAVQAPRPAAPLAAAKTSRTAIERARSFIHAGPENTLQAPSRLGPPGVFARRVLFRLLRPYAVRQRELDAAVVEAVDEASTTATRQGEELARVVAELTAMPYTSDSSFVLTDDRGSPQLGYRAGSGSDLPADYRGFEQVFRGSEDFIRERQRVYVELVKGCEPVLDIGCGRGEFLELLSEAGIAGRGIDVDEHMVARCREKGLDAELAEASEHLAGLEDGTLGTVFTAQVVEHLESDELNRFFDLVHRKLAPGGLLIAETINPHSIQAFKTFWVDRTHRAPIFPEVALVLCRLHGFEEARVVFPLGTGKLEADRSTQGEYAVVARKGAEPSPS